MKNNIKIYGVKDAYIKYLSQYQEHLFLHEGGSFGRKYVELFWRLTDIIILHHCLRLSPNTRK